MNKLNIVTEGSGPPILLVNGLIHDLTTWNYYAKILSKNNKVIRFDFPNQGLSYDDEDLLKIDDQSEIVLEVLRKTNTTASDTIVIAQSAGAATVRNLHCNMNVDFKQMILFGINPGQLENYYNQIYTGYIDLLESSGSAPYYRSIAPMLFSPLFYESFPEALDSILTGLESQYRDREKALITLVKSTFHDHTLANPPTDFRNKTTIMYGDLDYLMPKPKYQEYFMKCNSNVSIKEFSGGHCFAFESPHQVIKEVINLI